MTPKQHKFAQEYLIDLNATQAAIRAGYSAKTAASIGDENLRKPVIAAAIAEAQAVCSERCHITQDMVLKEIWRVAGVDVSAAYNEDGSLKGIHEIPEDTRRALAGLDVLEEFAGSGEDRMLIGHTKKVRVWDKVAALKLVAQHLGMLKDRVEVSGRDGAPIEIIEIVRAFPKGADPDQP